MTNVEDEIWGLYDWLLVRARRIVKGRPDLAHDYAINAIMAAVSEFRVTGNTALSSRWFLLRMLRYDYLSDLKGRRNRSDITAQQVNSLDIALQNAAVPPAQEVALMLHQVIERMSVLKDSYGECLSLSAKGFEIEEIADRLGIPSKEVKWRMRYGRRIMRDAGLWDEKPRAKAPFAGVYREHNKWMAMIKIDGVTKYLGMFDTANQAAIAYDKEARSLPTKKSGKKRRLNFQDTTSDDGGQLAA